MRSAFVFLLLFMFSHVNAQLALVADKDGYVNVRQQAGTAHVVTGKVMNGDVVCCMEREGEWVEVDYYAGKHIATGYIHTSRLVMINSFSSLKHTLYKNDSIVFRNASLLVAVYCKPFIPKNNKLEYQKTEGYNALYKINHRTFWGTDGGLPAEEYKKITCFREGKPVVLPDSVISDVFNPNLDNTEVRYDPASNRWFIQALNSDGAGGYYVIWMFENGEYKNRAVFHGF